jgi:NAD-dependent deacetylase
MGVSCPKIDRDLRRIVVLTGAGISAESGLKTFRVADGLWEGHRVEGMASPKAWACDPGLVLEFYDQRRWAVREAQPHAAHRALVALERARDVRIVTQDVDDLHERAGSTTKVLHLHGEIMLARSTRDPRLVRHLSERDIELGDVCDLGSQLRPDIVWIGEMVPAMEEVVELVAGADVLVVVGTSLQVHPAAGLLEAAGV